MIVVPTPMPVTTPDVLMVPTARLLLLHVPPPVAFASEVVEPTQIVRLPVIAVGDGLTVTTAVAEQPPGSV
jgi:hypothetical protein